MDFLAVLFDLDGVLIDSEPLHQKAQRQVFADHAMDVPADFFAQFVGLTEETVFARAVAAYGADGVDAATLVAHKHRVFAARYDELHPVEGALDFVARLHALGLPLGLTTSATATDQQRAFDRFGLAPYFGAVVTVEDVQRPKPDPEPYRTTAERLGVAPEGCLVVEDSAHGVTAARGAGCTVAALTTSFPAAVLREAGARVVVDTFSALQKRLGL